MTPQQTEPVPFPWTRVERLERKHCPCWVAIPFYHSQSGKCLGYNFFSVYEEDWVLDVGVDINGYYNETDVKWIAPLIEPPKIDREGV